MKTLLKISSVIIISIGVITALGGIWGINFTYQNIARENITTPDDATIPEAPVRGPLTLKSEADIIRDHTLRGADNLTYAESPRQVEKTDEDGNTILDKNGEPIMISNPARATWLTATTLMNALNLGILSYAFSSLAVVLGLTLILIGIVFYKLSRKIK